MYEVVGNMIVKSKDTETYQLTCGCEHEFPFTPGKINSIEVATGHTTLSRALCPACRCVWYDDAKHNFYTGLTFLALTVQIKEGSEEFAAGAVCGYGKVATILTAIRHLEEKPWHEIKIRQITSQEYGELKGRLYESVFLDTLKSLFGG